MNPNITNSANKSTERKIKTSYTMTKQISNGVKIFFSIITMLFFGVIVAFASEEETEITNLAEADWVSPLIAALVIIGAIIAARIIRAGSKKQIK